MAGARCPMLRSKEREREREKEKRKRKERRPRREETSEEPFQDLSSWRVAQSHTRRKLRKSKTRESAPPTILNRARKMSEERENYRRRSTKKAARAESSLLC